MVNFFAFGFALKYDGVKLDVVVSKEFTNANMQKLLGPSILLHLIIETEC